MTKINSLELLKWLFWTVIAAYGLGYVAILTVDYVSEVPKSLYSCFPLALILVTFIIFYHRQIGRLDNHLPLKEKRLLKQTNARSIKVNGTHNMFLSSVKSIFASEALQAPSQLLYWQYGSYTIREDTVYEWLRKGWKRQTWGEAHPFSGNWMTKQRFLTLSSQNIDRNYHECLVILMSEYGLWLREPRQGVAGKILVSPTLCIEKFKGNWGSDN